jgi:hypothetical protein
MSPSDFLQLFGKPAPQNFVVDAGTPLIIAPDDDRVVLAFWGTTQAVQVTPQGQGLEVFAAWRWTLGDRPLILTHALHGPLVNIGWRVEMFAVTASVTVIQTFMRGPTTPARPPRRP